MVVSPRRHAPRAEGHKSQTKRGGEGGTCTFPIESSSFLKFFSISLYLSSSLTLRRVCRWEVDAFHAASGNVC